VKIDPAKIDPVEIEHKIMSEAVVEKTWEVPAHGDKGRTYSKVARLRG
jgi:hypothetical protein